LLYLTTSTNLDALFFVLHRSATSSSRLVTTEQCTAWSQERTGVVVIVKHWLLTKAILVKSYSESRSLA
jgi:hypothetical protein